MHKALKDFEKFFTKTIVDNSFKARSNLIIIVNAFTIPTSIKARLDDVSRLSKDLYNKIVLRIKGAEPAQQLESTENLALTQERIRTRQENVIESLVRMDPKVPVCLIKYNKLAFQGESASVSNDPDNLEANSKSSYVKSRP